MEKLNGLQRRSEEEKKKGKIKLRVFCDNFFILNMNSWSSNKDADKFVAVYLELQGACISVIWTFSVEKERDYREMQPPHQHSRINLAELKAQIVKRLGPEGSKQYFSYLHRFLSMKLSKVEFNKLCLRILGRENLPLHNQFIRSILRNACSAKAPPPPSHKDDALKYVTHVGGKEISADGYQQNGSNTSMSQASGSPGLSNGGDILPVSPRKARTGFRDRRSGDRRSALGPNGKTGFASHLSTTTQSSDLNAVVENGDMNPPDIGRPVQQHQGLMRQSDNESENLVTQPAKMSVARRSPDGSAPLCSKDKTELVARNDGKENSARSPLRAPLGVPFRPVSIGGARKALPSASRSRFISTFNDGALLDSLTLRERMEHIATAQGLEGVSVDCANLLNHGLDSYMKGLIRSCIELVGARSGHELTKNNAHKHHSHTKLINGVKQGHQYQIQNGGEHFGLQEQKLSGPISLQDVRVAMELNPRQLGEDWPLLLEKICTHAFEE
ncbi:hypothetical protein Salat_0007600 [Sesamum alatum]|uniref:Uncharacterized protein n=1 Tax=Sesamum alatum TaxID=300844 RepID=A0AAE1YV20_9LAMI|nr:hypothetical protein Salat_0007600 [Sesamum alatum]